MCARRILSKRRQQVADAVEYGAIIEPRRRWRMLTLTVRHNAGQSLDTLLRGLRAAWRGTRQRGTIQRAWRAHVRASIRVVEVTSGAHGWHPHVHVLVLTDDWREDESTALAATWRELVERELGPQSTPDDAHGVHWSRDVSEAYLAKLGLEVTGVAKAGSPWALVDVATDAYALARRLRDPAERDMARARAEKAHALWCEYERATRGVRALELDDRAASMAREGERMRLVAEGEGDSDALAVDSWHIEVTREALSCLRAIERNQQAATWLALRVVERARDPAEAERLLDAWIRDSLPAWRP